MEAIALQRPNNFPLELSYHQIQQILTLYSLSELLKQHGIEPGFHIQIES